MDVHEALVDYLASIKHLDEKSQAGYQQRLLLFAGWANAQRVSLELVNNKAVQAFLAYVRTHQKPHKAGKEIISTYTLASYVRCLWAFLHWCLADEQYKEQQVGRCVYAYPCGHRLYQGRAKKKE